METITHIGIDELATLIIGVLALFVGGWIRQSVPFLRRIDMPNAVVGAMVVAIGVLLLHVFFHIEVAFGSRTKDALLLIFFTTIGLSAKLAALKSGGKPLIILCIVTVVALVAQNLSGAALAAAWGAHPAYGILAGSLSFVGGPGNRDGLGQGTSGSGSSERTCRRRWRRDTCHHCGSTGLGSRHGLDRPAARTARVAKR